MTTYILKLKNKKDLNRLLLYNVKFSKVKYEKDSCFLYVDKDNYEKIKKYFKLYDISLYKIEGILKYQNLIKQNLVFIISMIVGLVFLYSLTFITFDIKIMTNKSELIKIIQNELDYYNLKKYQFIKSFNEKEQIKKNILTDHKDKFEWLEIDRIGTKYYIHILERIKNNNVENETFQSVIARKNAVILEIKATSGEIIRKVNDYVNKGDVIISGFITKKDEVKGIVKAEGMVYGETWYNVKVSLPKTYTERVYTKNSFNRFSLNIFNQRIFIFKNKKYFDEEYDDKTIIGSKLLPFSLNYTKIKERKKDTYFYTYQDAENIGLTLAKEKLVNSLKSDSKILYQKKLKLYEENSTIIIEVFFKVYENITDYQKITLGEGE